MSEHADHPASARFALETHSVEFIPQELRHGKPADLMPLWFAANMCLPVAAAGAATTLGGLSFGWATAGIVIGVVLGTLLVAGHSAQGPHLGLPQMIQSRAQFGYYGAAFPLLFAVFMYLGFYGAGAVLGAQALHSLVHMPVSVGILLLSVLSIAVAVFGYDFIHRFERYLAVVVGVAFVAVTLLLIFGSSGTIAAPGHERFVLGPFLLAVSVAATSQVGFAVYAADYSRYLPASVSNRSVFWYTYAGLAISGLWLMILGAWLNLHFAGGPVGGIDTVAGRAGAWFVKVTDVVLVVGILSINALNIYGSYMSSLSIATTFFRRWRGGLRLRLGFILPVGAVATYVSFLYKSSLLSSYETFLTLTLALIIPWTAINLTDYYLVRHGRYDPDEIHNPDGIYGKFSAAGAVAYLVGVAVQIPFMNNSAIDGPIAKSLHNGDISWLVGAVVAGTVYYAMTRLQPVVAARPVPVATREPPVVTRQ